MASLAEAKAEEKPNQMLTVLGSTTINGHVSTSAQWAASTEPLPAEHHLFPTVFITGPKVVREGRDTAGAPRPFRFTVHRLGGRSNELTVYLNFHSPGAAPVQGGVTIPAGAWKATSTWFVPDNGVPDGPRAFTASISSDPVRLQMPGALYKLRPGWPPAATVVILDPAKRNR